MTGFTIDIDGFSLPVGTVDDEWAEILRSRGYDPSRFNRVEWPTGASRWAMARLMILKAHLDLLLSKLGSVEDARLGPVSLSIRNDQVVVASMDRMFLLSPRSRIISQQPANVVEVVLVDERYWWNKQRFGPATGLPAPIGFNVTLDDKSKFFRTTLIDEEDETYTFAEAIEAVVNLNLSGIGTTLADFDDFSSESDYPRLHTDLGLRDLTTEGHSSASVLDRLLIASGHVLTVRTTSNPRRYRIDPVESGLESMTTYLNANSAAIVAGGAWGGIFVPPPQPGGIPSMFEVGQIPQSLLDAHAPEEVAVHFPQAIDDSDRYNFDDPDDLVPGAQHYATRKWRIRLSSAGKPAEIAGFGTRPLYDAHWSRFEVPQGGGDPEPVNDAEIDARAVMVSAIYFGRYSSGLVDVLLLGSHLGARWSGASCVDVALVSHGPIETQGLWTRIRSDLDDRTFGWRFDAPLDLSIGTVRSMPRPEGGVLLDSPKVGGGVGRFHPARITAINGIPPNATYDAVSEVDADVTVKAAVPMNRGRLDQSIIDYNPYPDNTPDPVTGDPCAIIEYEDQNRLVYFERNGVTTCAPPAPSPLSPLAAHGSIG